MALLRKQVEMAEQDRHEQNAPRFAVTWSPTNDSYDDGAWFTIAYAEGPPRLDKVMVSVIPDSDTGAEGLTLDENERPERLSIELTSMVGGIGRRFIALVNDDDSGVVFLVTAEAGTGTWGPVPVTATEVH